jgi:2-keto-4-pentenoate hydratase
VAPSIEIIDSRIEDWRIKLPDTIADNASSAGVVLGEFVPTTKHLSFENIEAQLLVNDEVVAIGTGKDVLGHPAAAVAWLVNKLADFDVGLAAGDIVMPGSCTKAVDVRPGDHVRAEFTQIGDVSFSAT